LLAIAVVAALTGAVAAMSGNYAALRYSVLFGVMMALVAALGLAFRRISAPLSAQVRTVQHGDAVATEIRYSARQFWLLVALMACGALFCLGAAIEVFLRRGHDTFPGASLILGALGILFASYLIAVLLGRLCRGGITLSTKGIGQRGWSFESFLQWPAVAGVKPAYNGYPVILVIGYTNAEWPHR
jgi:uncharacterized membrane protein